MKVILYASNLTTDRFILLLQNMGIDVEVVSREMLADINTLKTNGPRDIHLAFVDSGEEEVESVCKYFQEECQIPVAMLINDASVNWQRLFNLDVYGFVSCTGGKDIVTSRLKSVTRRFKDTPKNPIMIMEEVGRS
jgi:hypothetical protein